VTQHVDKAQEARAVTQNNTMLEYSRLS
jgi:hypothetical protein